MLHSEHLQFLASAGKKGDYLLLGLESDKRVKQLKGKGRPVNTIKKRMKNLEKSGLVDYIFPLPEKFSTSAAHELLISQLRPRILAVSSHTLHQDRKKIIVERYGGQIRVVWPYNSKISSSILLADL